MNDGVNWLPCIWTILAVATLTAFYPTWMRLTDVWYKSQNQFWDWLGKKLHWE